MWIEEDYVPESSPLRIFKYKIVESNPEIRQTGKCHQYSGIMLIFQWTPNKHSVPLYYSKKSVKRIWLARF